MDRNAATDMVLAVESTFRLSCRVRDFSYNQPGWHSQFTVRSARPSGVITELTKIESGLVTWGFYGFQKAPDVYEVDPWWIIDWNAFNNHWQREKNGKHHLRFGTKWNPDGTGFHYFYYSSFAGVPEILVDASYKTQNA